MKTIEEILETEDIRYADGRWSEGFVDASELDRLLLSGYAESYDNQGLTFIRKK